MPVTEGFESFPSLICLDMRTLGELTLDSLSVPMPSPGPNSALNLLADNLISQNRRPTL